MRWGCDTLTADGDVSIGEEGLKPPPELTLYCKLSVCFVEETVDPDPVKRFGEVEESDWEM